MLSPIGFVPKRRASICSVDSGYASNTFEDDDHSQVCSRAQEQLCWTNADAPQLFSQPSSTTNQPSGRLAQAPFGLGIEPFWNVHIEDQLLLRKPDSPVGPVTTKLNVFTVKATSSHEQHRPATNDDSATCLACLLWDLTNPGEGTKCDGCKSQDFIRPDVLHLFNAGRRGENMTPHLFRPTSSRHSLKTRRLETRCSACKLARAIDPTASACPSCLVTESFPSRSPTPPSTVKRSCARRTTKLPAQALQRLQAWLEANREHPYPSADTKRLLAQECCIAEKQVATWFTNTRARKLARDRSHESSDDEGAYDSDYSSFANTPVFAANPAIALNTTSVNHSISAASGVAGHDSNPLTLQTSRRGKKKDYGKVNAISPIDELSAQVTPKNSSPNLDGQGQEMWQCTFCFQHLVPKSWRRHEETQHRPKHQWTCLATGPRLTVSSRTGTASFCAFCSLKNPNEEHFIRSHRISECRSKSEADRTFGRPDHLRQHIKNFHKTSLLDAVRDKWRRDGPGKSVNEGWTCGFCKAELKTWNIRETHVANHFKDGMTMVKWQEYPQPASFIAENPRRRQSHEAHSSMFSRMQKRLTERANRQPDCHISPVTDFSNMFEPLPRSSDCTTIGQVPFVSQMPDMDLGIYVPDNFTPNFDLFSAAAVGNFGAIYSPNAHVYDGGFTGDEGLQVDYGALASTDIYGNFGGFHGVWDQGYHN